MLNIRWMSSKNPPNQAIGCLGDSEGANNLEVNFLNNIYPSKYHAHMIKITLI